MWRITPPEPRERTALKNLSPRQTVLEEHGPQLPRKSKVFCLCPVPKCNRPIIGGKHRKRSLHASYRAIVCGHLTIAHRTLSSRELSLLADSAVAGLKPEFMLED